MGKIKRFFLKLTTDVTFKAFLRRSKTVCFNFLCDVVPDFRGQQIEVVDYVNTDLSSADPKEKDSALDVVAKLSDGKHVNVEMQCLNHPGLTLRFILYLCQLFASLVLKGMKSADIKAVYLVLITRFKLFPELEKVCNAFGFRADEDAKVLFTDKLRIVTVELPKRDKSKPIEKLDKDEQWSYLIEEAHIATEEDMSRLANLRPEMREAVDHAAEISRDVQLKLRAISIEKAEGMRSDREDYVREQGLEQGHVLGRAEGHAAGHAEGHAEGRAAGLEQGALEERHNMARRMLKANKPMDEISEFTGLSEVEILKL